MKGDKHDLNDILDRLYESKYSYLTKEDFYPILDERCYKSGVEDIYGGDNFADYCKDMFEYLEETGYYD